MKRFYSIIFICVFSILTTLCCLAGDNKISFNSKDFFLKYSKSTPMVTINEYYLPVEKGYAWSELITLLKVTRIDNPEMYAMGLAQNLPMSKLITIDKDKSYIVTFIASKKQNDGTFYLEPNVLKVSKCKEKGVCTIQYARQYNFKEENAMKSKIDSYIINEEPTYINMVKKVHIPPILEKDYQAW